AIKAPKLPQAQLDEMRAQARLVRRGGGGGAKVQKAAKETKNTPRKRSPVDDPEPDPYRIVQGVASNPGRICVHFVRWISHRPTWPIVWASLLVLSLLPPIFAHWTFWILTALLLLVNVWYWMLVRSIFWNGDANPGIVVDTLPLMIAVATDLTKGRGIYP